MKDCCINLDIMLMLMFSIFASVVSINGQCSLSDQPRDSNVCVASVVCEGNAGNLNQVVKNDWDCIKHTRSQYNYDEYGRYRHQTTTYYDDQYYLYLEVRNVDINVSEDPLIGIREVTAKVKTLTVEKGNLVTVPIIVSELIQLTNFSLIYNEIETINLIKYAGLSSMQKINVSHNCITNIEVDADVTGVSSSITTIDISYNALETIPDNCFAIFSNLKYLDLSSNLLLKFDILTFEGMTQLLTLQLSNNKIYEIGQNFARFVKLIFLTLDNNQLTSLTDLDFRMLVNLEKLNLSSNFIKNIENRSLATLNKLQELDLSHNKINVISKTFFKNNLKMHKLSLSYNDIENIETSAFEANNITSFNIKNNYLSGSIEYDSFRGIFVENFDLSNQKVTKLGKRAFSAMSHHLKYLNLSGNLINNIQESAFESLTMLSKLDISSNNLTDIDIQTNDLTELTEYYLQNNKIKKITSKMFRNLVRLINLDLSQNVIVDIELNSFSELTNLLTLNLSNNNLEHVLTANIFQGLSHVHLLDLSNTRSMTYLNETFSGMVSLIYLNSSYSQLETIEYNSFKATGVLKVLDLSHNVLENFHVNTSSILQVTELYLNHNKLRNITSDTFKYLSVLEKLSLAFNNILYIDSNVLQTLSHLQNLDLVSNFNLHVKSDVFNNLVLSQVSLKNVRTKFNFENATNTSVTSLIISYCDIQDINTVSIYKIKNILKLDFSSNKIRAIDKNSFQDMAGLNWLDLSQNMISYIQPGSFLFTKMINTLNLYGNNLQSIQFGVLDGLTNLRILNLSSNAIHIFDVNLLHTTPHLTQLYLENNNLASIDFEKLSETGVKVLTVGGNILSCNILVSLKYVNLNQLNVTAERFDFNSENIGGITCRTGYSKLTPYATNTTNTTSEFTGSNETVVQLYEHLRLTFNETFSKIIALLENTPDYSDKITESFNNSQMLFYQQLRYLFNDTKYLLPQLVNNSHQVANDIKLIKSLLETNNNLTKYVANYKEIIYEPASKKVVQKQESPTHSPINKIFDNESKLDKSVFKDIKILLYVIVICLVSLILCSVLGLVNMYLYKKLQTRSRINALYNIEPSVINGIEME